MLKQLRTVDYNAANWDEIDLSSDTETHRAFWSAVLQLAVADNAQCVTYKLDREEDCLAVEIDGQEFVMVPPSAELRGELLESLRTFALSKWTRILNRNNSKGEILLETPIGRVVWRALFEPNSVKLYRVSK